jgi:cysteinyl-tRNA synthetase
MEDKEEGTVVKVVGRDTIQKERELERQAQQEKAKAKAEQKRRLEEAKRQREEQAAIPPDQMFRSQTDKYSKFDDKGIPTDDQTGKPLSDKQIKKLLKLWQAQEKKHAEHLNKM